MSGKRTIVESPITGDRVVRVEHPSGLTVLVCEMEGFSTVEALFGTRYGSIDTTFKTESDEDYVTVPEGIAHYLEHKLFENEDSDVFELYAQTGASANAYTSFDRTCYLFSCSEGYLQSLEILLSFVQSPYFTKETVEKEQGIIGQEIQMCNDNPSWRVFYNMLRAMYRNHPVRVDIAGTVESIAKIDADLLYRCYRTFYNLHNMVLSVAGNVKVDDVLEVCDRLLKPCDDPKLETVVPDEPESIVRREVVEHIPVGIPQFYLGFKSKPESGRNMVRAELETCLLLDTIADASSPLYEGLLHDQLINSEFGTETFYGDGYFCALFSGESIDPRAVRDRVFEEVRRAKEHGIDRERFEIAKRCIYGSIVTGTERVQSMANCMLSSYFDGVDPFDYLDTLASITYEDVQGCLSERLDPERAVLSIVE